MRIKCSALDRLFSQYIRARESWTCTRCSKRYSPPTNALHTAHIFGRRSKLTRWDERNATAWCYGCHSYMDSHPLEKYDWYITRFGQELFDQLRLRSNMAGKVDQAMIAFDLRNKLKRLERGR